MPNIHSKTILVTGGAGYIGSHTCKMLKSQGYEPITFDNLSNGHEHAVQWGSLIQGDLRKQQDIQAAFESYNYAAVIHFAGDIEVGESVQNPEKYYSNNIAGTLNLLKVMKEHSVNTLVFSSTCAIHGTPATIPINEDMPQNPVNPYGWSKMMIEQILHDYSNAHDLNYIACRYFNACGADPDLQIGEEHSPETHLIPLALMTAAGQRKQISIYGTDYPTKDGTCIRDYIHVQDLANAHIKALQYLENGGKSQAINCGTGQGYSVKDILKTIENITKCTLNIKEENRRAGDTPVLIADTAKAQKILGFTPQISDLNTIIQTAWDFHQSKHPK